VDVAGGVTGWKDGISRGLKGSGGGGGGLLGRFGVGGVGASEHSSDMMRGEWEEDRRSMANRRRERSIMGGAWGEEQRDGTDGTSFQKHLDSLVEAPVVDGGNEDGLNWDDTEPNESQQNSGGNASSSSSNANENYSMNDQEDSSDWHASMSENENNGNSQTGEFDEEIDSHASQNRYSGDTSDKQSYRSNTPLTDSNLSSNEAPGGAPKNSAGVDPSTFFGGGGGRAMTPSRQTPQQGGGNSNYYNDDDDTAYNGDRGKASLTNRMRRMLPPMKPRNLLRRRSLRKRSGMDAAGWSDDEDRRSPASLKTSNRRSRSSSSNRNKINATPTARASKASTGQLVPVTDLLQRRMLSSLAVQKATANLLSSKELKRCIQIGKRKAFLDFISLVSILFFVKELSLPTGPISLPSGFRDMPQSWRDGQKLILTMSQTIFRVVSSSKDTVRYYPLIVLLLSTFTSRILCEPTLQMIATNVSKQIKLNVVHAQLYLRLISGIPLQKWQPQAVSDAVKKQIPAVVENARIRSFVFLAVTGLSIVKISVVRLVMISIVTILYETTLLDTFRQRPIAWTSLTKELGDLITPFKQNIRNALTEQLRNFQTHPIMILPTASLFIALLGMAFLPSLERRHAASRVREDSATTAAATLGDDYANADIVSNMGKSSTSRLLVQNHDGTVEYILRRWKMMHSSATALSSSRRSAVSNNVLIFRKLGYSIFYSALVLLPIVTHIVLNDRGIVDVSAVNWDKCVHVGLLLLFTQKISTNAMSKVIESSKGNAPVVSFLNSLAVTVDEINRLKQNPKADLRMSANSSSSKGILVSDLWAAHTSKRAWACRGSSISCNPNEVVVVLGDDASGKSRLLTAIGETIMLPLRRSRSTTLARGTVSIGGVDVTKWDKMQLKQKVGILLNDIRTLADTSHLFSGLTLKEILEPINTKAVSSDARRNAVEIAMQITGLSDSLLKRLDTKLLTVVTSNEPSISQPAVISLSPAEWSKVLLTKVIAQSILCNDNPISSPDSVHNCLLGTILLLDDVTLHLSEIEEGRLIKALRITGAATILTSNRWSFGRFADRVALTRNGSIVETGTHLELLARGDQRSIYASKWSQMAQE